MDQTTDLKELREAVRPPMTQREMARRLGLSSMFVSDLERGRRSCSEARRAQYLAALESFKAEHEPAEPVAAT